MLRQHIDFIAVFFIGVAMIAISQAPFGTLPVRVNTAVLENRFENASARFENASARFENASMRVQDASVRLRKASNNEPCEMKRAFLENLADFLNP
jgi:hypothetical protein